MQSNFLKLYISVLSVYLSSVTFVVAQQQDFSSYNKERNTIQKKGMATLGIWSLGNIAWGTVGTLSNDGVNQQFHNMNILWNAINLTLAIPGYIGASKGENNLSIRKTFKEQTKAEKTFLFNAGLDVAYIFGGLYLTERAKTASNKTQHDRNLGFGNSIMLQGGFLFLLDYTLYSIHSRHGNKKLTPLLDNMSIGANGVGYIHRF